MSIQASEDVLIELAKKFDMDEYGTVNENGGYLIGEVRKLIRNEKLKLLAEVRERVVGEDEPGVTNIMIAAEHAKQIANLTKLEAEL